MRGRNHAKHHICVAIKINVILVIYQKAYDQIACDHVPDCFSSLLLDLIWVLPINDGLLKLIIASFPYPNEEIFSLRYVRENLLLGVDGTFKQKFNTEFE